MRGSEDSRPLRIGEACRYLGVSRTTLLAAEEAGLVVAGRTPGGHRRYDRSELDRLRRGDRPAASHGRGGTDEGPTDGADDPVADAEFVRADLPDLVRVVLRDVVRLLRVRAAALWIMTGARGPLRFCVAFRMPRWATDRLRASGPPVPVLQTLATGQRQMFDATSAGLTTGEGDMRCMAVTIGTDDQPSIGVLVLMADDDHEWLPSELRAVGTLRGLVATTVVQGLRIGMLEEALARIRHVAGTRVSRS